MPEPLPRSFCITLGAMSAAQLLKHLAGARRYDRAALAAIFGVSDQMIDRWLNELTSQGIAVAFDHSLVELRTNIDWLKLESIEQQSPLPFTVELSLETGSTSADLQRRVQQQNIHRLALTTEYQQAGRGRLGRNWRSPIAQNIALSVGWQFHNGAALLEGLSLAIGASLAEALEAAFGVSLHLKWPNDLYMGDRKCGGILVDVSGDLDRSCAVIVGVGLNLHVTERAGEVIDQPWAALASILPPGVSRSKIVGVMLDALSAVLHDYESTGFGRWHALYSKRDWLAGQSVAIEGGVRLEGQAAGISDQGALLVQSGAELVPVFAGEARLARRPKRLSDDSSRVPVKRFEP